MNGGPPPVTVFTFFLALPFALPIPNGMNPGFVEPRTEIWDGWSPADLGRMVGQGEAFTTEAVPGTRMAIRHHGETMAIPFVAVFDAFVDWIEPPLSEEEFEALRADVEEHRDDGMAIVQTTVALSRFVPRSAHSASGEVSVGWLLDLFRQALGDLGKLLSALGLVTQRWDLGSVPPRLLPALVPILIESSHPNAAGERQGTTSIIPLQGRRRGARGGRRARITPQGPWGSIPFFMSLSPFFHACASHISYTHFPICISIGQWRRPTSEVVGSS